MSTKALVELHLKEEMGSAEPIIRNLLAKLQSEGHHAEVLAVYNAQKAKVVSE